MEVNDNKHIRSQRLDETHKCIQRIKKLEKSLFDQISNFVLSQEQSILNGNDEFVSTENINIIKAYLSCHQHLCVCSKENIDFTEQTQRLKRENINDNPNCQDDSPVNISKPSEANCTDADQGNILNIKTRNSSCDLTTGSPLEINEINISLTSEIIISSEQVNTKADLEERNQNSSNLKHNPSNTQEYKSEIQTVKQMTTALFNETEDIIKDISTTKFDSDKPSDATHSIGKDFIERNGEISLPLPKISIQDNNLFTKFIELNKASCCDWIDVLPDSVKEAATCLMLEYQKVLNSKQNSVQKTGLVQKLIQQTDAAKEMLTYLHGINFLLIGCSGNGKSATGNSILGTACFETTSSTTSTESNWVYKSTFIEGIKVGVIDGPGIDTNSSNDDILKTAAESFKKALELCNYNFTALLIVLKYGSRYTKQEGLTIKLLKGLLGENIIADCGICVFTHGDTFYDDQKYQDSPISFDDWCKEQEGEIKQLFKECRDRIVIFNNKTREEKEKTFQVKKLFITLTEHVISFSKDDYKSSKNEREIFEQENLNSEIKKKIEQRLSEIRSELRSLESKSNGNQLTMLKELQNLEHELDKCLAEIPSSSKNVRSLVLALVLEIQSKRKLIEFEKQNGITGPTSVKDNAETVHTESFSKKPKNKFKSTVSKFKKRVFKK